MKRLTNEIEREAARREIASLLDARGEWFCAEGKRGAPMALRPGEWELSAAGMGVHFSYLSERGLRVWRVTAWEWTGERLLLEVVRRAGAERATLELVPRASAQAGIEVLRAARQAACEQLAKLVCEFLPGAKIERVRLSAGARRTEPGRYARILLRRGGRGGLIAVTGAVVNLKRQEADAVVSSALLWWSRLRESVRKEAISELHLIVTHELREPVMRRLALLSADVRRELRLWETNEGWRELALVPLTDVCELLAASPRFQRPAQFLLSETAARIVALAPEEIDVVRARHGETLRYRGLPFARVRRVSDAERVWFGVATAGEKTAARRLLDEGNWPQLAKLLAELSAHRRADAPDLRHAFYRAMPESWLESLLRRDITQLDPGLIIAPLHAQFRAARDGQGTGVRPVDLLALRRDGRLVVIELKTSEDAALALQAADYWRQLEAHRRAGHITQAKLFGDLPISDELPLVYLVAPFLRFHRSFHALARLISPEIEMYRFDLNEDWRTGVRVVRRTRVS